MKRKTSILLFGSMICVDIFFWAKIVPHKYQAQFVMLDVGQGDSSLFELPSGAVVLTDAGPVRSVTRSLDKITLPNPKYIDLAVVTHPQLDHYGGFSDLLDHYDIGAFLMTGRVPDADSLEWDTLMDKLKTRHIPIILVSRGDYIIQGSSRIDILSPNATFRESGELNDTGIVERVSMVSTTILLTADIGEVVETYLTTHDDIRADILKVPHHGSRYSSTEKFLKAVQPKVATIGVGENHYGHPAPGTLERLGQFVGKNIFRTDKDGTVQVLLGERTARVRTEE